MPPDEKYMQHALQLAQRGVSAVEPNPAVGCIIVKNDRIIGQGWHEKFGGLHAEINALADASKNSEDVTGSTIYVTLEPCSHHDKTPPCTDALISAKIKKVFVAMIDPSAHADSRGIKQLRNAGLDVAIGLCEGQAKLINAPFIKFAKTSRLWVIVKWAQSADGKLARKNQLKNRWISNDLAREDAHKLRRRAAAILVGINTVLTDDPLLTPRPSKGRKPLRIILDNNLRIPLQSQLFTTAKDSGVLICTTRTAADNNREKVELINQAGAQVLAFPDTQNKSNLHLLMDDLAGRAIQQLLVEGGAKVITSFLTEKLADEIIVYMSPETLGPDGDVPISSMMAELTKPANLHHAKSRNLGDNLRISGLTSDID